MATIGEILAAKGKTIPRISGDDDYIDSAPAPIDSGGIFEETPETKKPDDKEQAQSAPQDDSADLDKLKSDMAASARDADADVMFRRASAAASLGRQNPDQIDTKDIEARRNAPLQMYQQRQAAKKQAAESALAAAHARYFGAETAEIPKREAREGKKLDADIQDAQDRLDEAKRSHDLTAASEAENRLNQLQMERERQAGETARNKPYETQIKINPVTGDQEVITTNKQTGQTTGEGGTGNTPHDVLEHYQARRAGLDKPLDALDSSQEELQSAEAAVRAHPESFDSVKARGGEMLAGAVPVVGGAIAARLGPALRGDEGQKARQAALQAAAGRIHELAGTRGFSQTERATMATLVPSENDNSANVLRKLQQAEELSKRASDRLRSKLPVNNPPGGTPSAKIVGGKRMYQDPRTGQVMVDE